MEDVYGLLDHPVRPLLSSIIGLGFGRAHPAKPPPTLLERDTSCLLPCPHTLWNGRQAILSEVYPLSARKPPDPPLLDSLLALHDSSHDFLCHSRAPQPTRVDISPFHLHSFSSLDTSRKQLPYQTEQLVVNHTRFPYPSLVFLRGWGTNEL